MRCARAAVALVVAAAVAGCGSTHHTGTTTTVGSPTTGATTTTGGTTSTSSATSGSTASTSTTASGPPRCTNLSVSAGQSQGAAGTIGVPLVFVNTGSTTCVLGGYPGVALLDASGAQAVQAQRTGSSGSAVTLAPRGSASALLTGSDVPRGNATSCPSYPAALVTPPGSTVSSKVDLSSGAGGALPGCATPLIRAVVAGASGQ